MQTFAYGLTSYQQELSIISDKLIERTVLNGNSHDRSGETDAIVDSVQGNEIMCNEFDSTQVSTISEHVSVMESFFDLNS